MKTDTLSNFTSYEVTSLTSSSASSTYTTDWYKSIPEFIN